MRAKIGLVLRRREFLSGVAGVSILPADLFGREDSGRIGRPETRGELAKGSGPSVIPGAEWYIARKEGDGLVYRIAPGTLAKVNCLTADLLLDGETLVVFNLLLEESEAGRTFRFAFGGLNQCSFRLRMPLSLLSQNRWMMDREGAFLKPMASGDRISAEKVDRIVLQILRKSSAAARWCMTPLTMSAVDVPKLSKPVLPDGALLDEFGQSRQREWGGKTRSADELKKRIQKQHEIAFGQKWAEQFSRWGGWRGKKLGEGSGFFRTQKDDRRSWLVDPDGFVFWSTGLDCVRVDTDARFDGIEGALTWLPESQGEFADIYKTNEKRERDARIVNYLAANMIRAFGRGKWREKWAQIVLSEMKRLRFNTVGNWSDWQIASAAKVPYVRPLEFRGKRCGMIYRDFPDVFHPGFEADCVDAAIPLRETAADSALVGYFLMNEPTWGFRSETPGAAMLYNAEGGATREELTRFLKTKYGSEATLSAAWQQPVTYNRVASAKWTGTLSTQAVEDLRIFSVHMVERHFSVLSKACKQIDPHHLNLGMRWAGVPPDWAVEGMRSFDVFSLNCYRENLPRDVSEKIHSLLGVPVLVGEYHFGALDAGLPASGIGRLKNQEERAKAYRNYLEDAAANPWCVGAHWFTLYDESALGRYDGENYNIGFLDVCNRPYEEMSAAAIASHERMYDVADGRAEPFHEAIEYLPKLYL
jgi:hypothetical protein